MKVMWHVSLSLPDVGSQTVAGNLWEWVVQSILPEGATKLRDL